MAKPSDAGTAPARIDREGKREQAQMAEAQKRINAARKTEKKTK